MTNAELKETYDAVYKQGSQKFYSVDSFHESLAIHEMCDDLRGKRVLEIGCGEGRLAALLAMAGAKLVDAYDYSREAISIANDRHQMPGLLYVCGDYHTLPVSSHYDVVVMQGVLEHLDDWRGTLVDLMDNRLEQDGYIVTSCPSFINPRGYVWQALRILLSVPMSLTDRHYLCPFDFQRFCKERGYLLEYTTIRHDWSMGETCITDYQKRLTNALRDGGLPTDSVDAFLDWFEQALDYEQETVHNGAIAVYRIDKP